jgi:hypothetical protein
MTQPPARAQTVVGRPFGAPLIIEGYTWLPAAQIIIWGVMAWLAGKRRPQRTLAERLAVGAITMPVALGSEWGHNLAHAAAAQAVGRPMDELRIYAGMPRVVYHELNDTTVTPCQHIARASGGPVFSLLLAGIAWLLRALTRPQTLAREVADVAVITNTFIGAIAWLPIPGIDGGPVLKWSLVQSGRSIEQADKIVQQTNAVLGAGLAAGAAVAYRQRRRPLALLIGLFAISALAYGLGLIKEQRFIPGK